MRGLFVFLAFLNFSACNSIAGVEFVEVRLPQLEGFYEVGIIPFNGTNKVSPIVLDPSLGKIVSVGLRISGNFTLGVLEQEVSGTRFDWPMVFLASTPGDTVGVTWSCELQPYANGAGVLEWPGGFYRIPFDDDGSDSMDFLRNGTSEMEFQIWPAGYSFDMRPIVYGKTGDLSEVMLLLEVETPTPVENNSWGTVKALFR